MYRRWLSLLLDCIFLLLLALLWNWGVWGLLSSATARDALSGAGWWLSQNASELLCLGLSSLTFFLLPLLSYPRARHFVCGALRCVRFGGELWGRVLVYALLLMGGSAGLSVLAEWAVGLLPASWGISTEDAVAQQLQHLLTVGRWYEPLLMVLSLALVPAVVEELCFRAYLQRAVVRLVPHRPWVGIALVSALFALIHASLVGFAPRFALALGMGYAYYRRGNIAVPITIHLFNNFVTLMLYIEF